MHIPAKYQSLVDTDQDTVERVRKGRGRLGAYRSADPAVRRRVRLDTTSEMDKSRRNARAIKVDLQCPETLSELLDLAYSHYRAAAALQGRAVSSRAYISTENLHRITVNYLRHERTIYDNTLVRKARSGGADHSNAYNQELKIRCLEVIAARFPELGTECDRQLQRVTSDLARATEVVFAAGTMAA
jgi:Arc/MetJ-type ribon-helix-helix transcriptional regulator